MGTVQFASALRVAPSRHPRYADLELVDARGGTIAAAHLDATTAAILIRDLSEALGMPTEPAPELFDTREIIRAFTGGANEARRRQLADSSR